LLTVQGQLTHEFLTAEALHRPDPQTALDQLHDPVAVERVLPGTDLRHATERARPLQRPRRAEPRVPSELTHERPPSRGTVLVDRDHLATPMSQPQRQAGAHPHLVFGRRRHDGTQPAIGNRMVTVREYHHPLVQAVGERHHQSL
jgi:hypothetical protein